MQSSAYSSEVCVECRAAFQVRPNPIDGRGFPRRSYAKIDQIEPPSGEGDTIVIMFDAVDAEWDGFRDGMLSLSSVERPRIEQFWRRRFNHAPMEDPDPFEEIPLYRIELTLDRGHPWMVELSLSEEDWFDINLDDSGEVEVDVYPAIFAPPTTTYMSIPPRPSAMAESLNAVFDDKNWPISSQQEIENALPLAGYSLETFVALDIGQGSAIALHCPHGVIYYFDVGCGTHGNAKTRPPSLQFCDGLRPVIILSHWDSDHWAGAVTDTALQTLTWIVPHQAGLPTHHITFANNILKSGGKILVFPKPSSPFNWKTAGQELTLISCTGKTRNGSGLALVAREIASGNHWLFTGDAGYNEIPGLPTTDVVALTVPHHGADMTHLGSPPPPAGQTYRRAVYSFGPGNSFGKKHIRHPVAAAVADHESHGWAQGTWKGVSNPGYTTAGADVLATGTHLSTHDGGAAVSFGGSPYLPLAHEAGCAKPMPIKQI